MRSESLQGTARAKIVCSAVGFHRKRARLRKSGLPKSRVRKGDASRSFAMLLRQNDRSGFGAACRFPAVPLPHRPLSNKEEMLPFAHTDHRHWLW